MLQRKGKHSKYYYLQHHDGTLASKRQVAALSFDACKLWVTLKDEKRAPKTFSKMLSSAWEFFSCMLLTDPDHAFLHWCDDGEWKLQEWATQNYSLWTLNTGLREKKPKEKKAKGESTILDDPKLLHMQDEDGDGDKDKDKDEENKDKDKDKEDKTEDDDDDNDNNPSKNVHNHAHVLDESAQRVDKGKSVDKGNPPPQMQAVSQSSPQPQARLTSNNV
jgi:hypothetical protein